MKDGDIWHFHLFVLLTFILFFQIRISNAANCGGATPCACADTVIENYTMTYNLNCTGTGLIIGANDLILDCSGYSINFSMVDVGNGIEVVGKNNVTIKNCVILQQNASFNTTAGMNATWFFDSNRSFVQNSSISTDANYTNGIAVSGSSRNNSFSNLTLISNGSYSNGIRMYGTGSNTISGLAISNTSIRNTGIYAYGMVLYGYYGTVTNNLLYNITINTTGYGSNGIYTRSVNYMNYSYVRIYVTNATGFYFLVSPTRIQDVQNNYSNVFINDIPVIYYSTGYSLDCPSSPLNFSNVSFLGFGGCSNVILENTTTTDMLFYAFGNNSIFRNITINTKGSGLCADGNMKNNTFSFFNITSNGYYSYAAFTVYGSFSNISNNTFSNFSISVLDTFTGVIGMRLDGDNSNFENNTFSNFSINSKSGHGIYFYGYPSNYSNNRFVNFTILINSSFTGYYGIQFHLNVNTNFSKNTLANFTIITVSGRQAGIRFGVNGTLSDNVFSDFIINTTQYDAPKLMFYPYDPNTNITNNLFSNFTFLGQLINQTYFSYTSTGCFAGNNLLLNATNFNRSAIFFKEANNRNNITVQWYARANVTDFSGNPLYSASANSTNNQSISQDFGTTNANGLTSWFVLNDTLFSGDGNNIIYSMHNITVNRSGVVNSTNTTVNQSMTVNIYLDSPTVSCNETISQSTTMNKDLNCSATGIIIGADNVTLDCAGHYLNYSIISVANGIEARNRNNTQIKNCRIYQQNVSVSANYPNATFLYNTNNSAMDNITIRTSASRAYGLAFENSNNNNFTFFNITTFGTGSYGAFFVNSNNSKLLHFNISTISSSGYGVYLSSSNNDTVYNFTINVTAPGVIIGWQLLSHYQHNISNITINGIPAYYYARSYSLPCPSSPLNFTNVSFLGFVDCGGVILENTTTSDTLVMSFVNDSRVSYSSLNSKYRGLFIIGGINSTYSNLSIIADGVQTPALYVYVANNHTFSDCNITNPNSIGIYLRYSNNHRFSNMRINSSSTYPKINPSVSCVNNTFANITIVSQSINDTHLGEGTGYAGNTILLNITNFNRSAISFDAANNQNNATIQWYIRFNVTDFNNNLISGVSMNATNNQSISQDLGTTNANGLTSWFVLNDTLFSGDGNNIIYSMHNFTANRSGIVNSTNITVNDSMTVNIYLDSSTISCNETISQSTTMNKDLNCSATGIIIGADNVTLDCAGHFINFSQISVGNGIEVVGRNNITIKNCIILQQNNTFNDTAGMNASWFFATNNSQVSNTTISTFANYTYGITIYRLGRNLSYSNISIYTNGSFSNGIRAWCTSSPMQDMNFTNINITNEGTYAYGITLQGYYCSGQLQYNRFSNILINTTKYGSFGIYLWYARYNNFSDVNITTVNASSIFFESYSFSCTTCIHNFSNVYMNNIPIHFYTDTYSSCPSSPLNFSNASFIGFAGCNNVILENSTLSDTLFFCCGNNSNFRNISIDSKGTGMLLQGSMFNNFFSNYTISFYDGWMGLDAAPGVFIFGRNSNINNNTFSNFTIVRQASISYSSGLDFGCDYCQFENNSFSSFSINAGSRGIVYYGITTNITSNKYSNFTITTTSSGTTPIYVNLYSGSIFNNNSFTNFSLTSTASHGIDLRINGSLSNNTFSQFIINTTQQSAAKIQFYPRSTTTIISGNIFANFTFLGQNVNQTYFYRSGASMFAGDNYLLNTTNFNRSAISYLDADNRNNITVQWYARANVTDFSGNPLYSASSNSTNNQSISQDLGTTNAQGLTSWFVLNDTLFSGDGINTIYSIHNFTANRSGVVNSTNTTVNQSMTVNIYLDSPTVDCNETITSSTTMNQDLNCSATGIIIGADNITLDCAGHYINFSQISVGNGIESIGRNSITIKNCRIYQQNSSMDQNYANATYFYSSNNSVIQNTTIRTLENYMYSIVVSNSRNVTIYNNSIDLLSPSSATGYGIWLLRSNFSNITQNIIKKSTGTGDERCLYILYSDSNFISNNSINATTYGISIYSSSNNTFVYNQVLNSSARLSFRIDGIALSHYNNSIDSSNLIYGKPINYSFNIHGSVYDGIDYSQYGHVIFGWCSNITISNSNFSDEGLSFSNTTNSRVLNNYINSSKGWGGIKMFTNSTNNIISNNTAVSTAYTSYGVYLSYSPNCSVSNNYLNVTNGWSDGLHIYYSPNVNITNNTVFSSGSSSSGISFEIGDYSNIISNNFTITGGTSQGIYPRWGDNGNFANNIINVTNITSFHIYFYASGDDNLIANTTLLGQSVNQTYSYNGSSGVARRNILLNTTNLNISAIVFSAGANNKNNLTLQWYVRANVTDLSGNPVRGVSVNSTNNQSISQDLGTTNSNGLTNWYVMNDTLMTGSGNISYSLTNFTVNKSGIMNSSNFTINQTMTVNIVLNASTAECGDTLTENITLNKDINCSGNALIIGANDLTLDCAGHTIEFARISVANGIVSISRNNIIIRNCTFLQQNTGIARDYPNVTFFNSTNNSRFEYNNIRTSADCGYGIGFGAVFQNSTNWTIFNNTFTLLGTYSYGIRLATTTKSNISSNYIYSSSSSYGGTNIFISSGSNSNILDNNTLKASSGNYGIHIHSSSNATLRNNSVNNVQKNEYVIYGASISDFNHTIGLDNLAKGKPVNYTFNVMNPVYDGIDYSQYGEIIFAWASNLSLRNCNFTNTSLNLFNVTNSIVENNRVNASNATGIFIYSNSRDNTIRTNTVVISRSCIAGIQIASGYNNVINNSITTLGTSWMAGIELDYSNNNISFNTIATNGSSSYGIYIASIGATTILISNTISTNGSSAHGIYLQPTSNINLINMSITINNQSSAFHIYLVSSSYSNFFANLSFLGESINQIRTTNTTSSYSYSNIFLNITNLNRSAINFSDGADNKNNLTLQWYVRINVTNFSGTPLPGVSVNYTNNQSISQNMGTTDSSGLTAWYALNDTLMHGAGNIGYALHNFTVSKSGILNSTNTTVNNSMTIDILLDAPLISCAETIVASTTMNQDLNCSSNGLIIGVDNIALDCAGHAIEFARESEGNGITAIGRNNVTIKNCRIFQQNNTFNNSVGMNATFFFRTNVSTIINSSIIVSANYTYGISVYNSKLNNFTGISISTEGYRGRSVFLYTSSNNNSLSNLEISTTGFSSHGILIQTTSSNNSASNISISTGGSSSIGIYIYVSSTDNHFSNCTISTIGSASYGVYIPYRSDNNSLSNFTIYTNRTNAPKIYFYNSSGNIISNFTFLGQSVNQTFLRNSTDYYSGENLILNVENLNRSAFFYYTEDNRNNVTLQWYVRVNVSFINGTPVSGASVNATNNQSITQDLGTTGADGLTTSWAIMNDTMFRGAGGDILYSITNFTANYSIDVNSSNFTISNSQIIILYLNGTFVPAPPPSPDEDEKKNMNVQVIANYTNNPLTIIAQYEGIPIINALATLTLNSQSLSSCYTNSSGSCQLSASNAGIYYVKITLAGYNDVQTQIELLKYNCTTVDECNEDEICKENKCEKITGECGFAKNHQFISYECCADSQCASDYYCSNNICRKVEGECGYASAHKWINYGCCKNSDCSSGETCISNKCEGGGSSGGTEEQNASCAREGGKCGTCCSGLFCINGTCAKELPIELPDKNNTYNYTPPIKTNESNKSFIEKIIPIKVGIKDACDGIIEAKTDTTTYSICCNIYYALFILSVLNSFVYYRKRRDWKNSLLVALIPFFLTLITYPYVAFIASLLIFAYLARMEWHVY